MACIESQQFSSHTPNDTVDQLLDAFNCEDVHGLHSTRPKSRVNDDRPMSTTVFKMQLTGSPQRVPPTSLFKVQCMGRTRDSVTVDPDLTYASPLCKSLTPQQRAHLSNFRNGH
jgi:hypothetical protein